MLSVDREQFMIGLMDGAIAAVTMILKDEPHPPSMDNLGQIEAAIFLNNPWIKDNIKEEYPYSIHTSIPPIHNKYVERLREAISLPGGSASVLRKLMKAERVLLGE